MHLLTRLSLYKRWLTFLVVAVVIGVAIFATLHLKMEMIPNIEVPMTTVITVYPGASPEEVMAQVSDPIEGVISGIPGLDRMSSTSVENLSFIFLEFEYGTDMDAVDREIRQGLSTLTFPQGVPTRVPQTGDENPQVFPLNMSMLPLAVFTLSGDLEPNELNEVAKEQVIPELEKVKGVFSVSTEGGEEKILVSPMPGEMNDRGIAMSEMLASISGHQYSSIDEIKDAPLNSSTTLKDVAEVSVGATPGTAITRTDGETSVGIVVMKWPEANTVSVANAVAKRAEDIGATLPESVTLAKLFDQSDYIEQSLNDLTKEALTGGILAILVIFVFLATIRGSLIIAVSIPLSMLIGFAVMQAWGLTINILTLGAMGIAVGRVVDDSIVMLEVIYRRLRSGESFKEAALGGSREVAMPITTATLATVAIFLPLAFVGGMVGQLFVPFALTTTFTMLASLLVALTIVPAVSGVLMPKKVKLEAEHAWYQRIYTPALKWALAHRILTIAIAAALFLGSLALIPVVGTSFMPSMGEKEIMVDIEMPLGTDVNTTSEKAKVVEDVIGEMKRPAVELYYTTVGTSSSFLGGMSIMSGGGGSNTATIEILLTSDANLDKEVAELRDRIVSEGLMPAEGEGTILVSPLSSGMGEFDPSNFRVYILGEHYDEVLAAANDLALDLEEVKGLTNVVTDVSQTVAKPQIEVDEAKLAFHVSQGLNIVSFGTELTGMMNGTGTGVMVDGKEIYLTSVTQNASSAEELGGLVLYGGLSYPIKLANVADVKIVEEPTGIREVDQQRAVTITATVTDKDVGAVTQSAQKEINKLSEPGITTRMGGVSEYMTETFRDMGIAILVAVVIAFAIVVVSFRSFLNALIIMVSLPLASIGSMLGLLIAGYPLGASATMGMLMLVGIVLTNAIVLLALVGQLRQKGMSTYDALVRGGVVRIRPILMTAVTTMVGVLPLAVGLGGGGVLLASELAVVVLGGLISSTFLTLIVIPVLYSLTDRFRRAPMKANSVNRGS